MDDENSTFNEDKNSLDLTEEKKKELGILKVLKVVISEDQPVQYKVITEQGQIKTMSAEELL